MTWTFYLAPSRADTATRLFDFVDTAGATNPNAVQSRVLSLDLGASDPARVMFTPEQGSTARVTRTDLPPVTMTPTLRLDGASYDQLRLGLSRLLGYLQQPRVIVLKPDGSATTTLIDTIGVDSEALFRGGQLNLDQVVRLFRDVEGFALPILRQPVIDEPAPADNLLTNGLLLVDTNDDGTPDGWTITSTPTLSIAAATQSLHVVAGAAARGLFAASAAASVAAGQTVTIQAEVSRASGTIVVVLEFRTAADALLGSAVTLTFNTSVGFQRLTGSGVAPATTDHVRVRIESSGGAATFDVRRVKAAIEATVSAFTEGPTVVLNDPRGATFPRLAFAFNPGDVAVPARITGKLSASSQVADVLVARRSDGGVEGGRSVALLGSMPHVVPANATGNGWTITLGVDTTNVAPDAQIGTATSFTSWNRRIRATRTTKLDALRGLWRVMARVKQVTRPTTHQLRLAWAPSLADPPTNTNDPVTIVVPGSTLVSATTYIEVDLGVIAIPEDPRVALSGLALEVHTRCVTTVSNLLVTHLWLVPVSASYGDVLGRLFTGAGFVESFASPASFVPGASLTSPAGLTSGTVDADGSYHLDSVNDAVGSPPAAGGVWGAGVQQIDVDLSYSLGSVGIYVRNITDNVDAADRSVAPNELARMTFVSVAGKAYEIQVRVTSFQAGMIVRVFSMTRTTLAPIGGSESFYADPDVPTIARLTSAGQLAADLAGAGLVPVMLDPGLNALLVRSLEVPAPSLYVDPESNLTRTITVSTVAEPARLV